MQLEAVCKERPWLQSDRILLNCWPHSPVNFFLCGQSKKFDENVSCQVTDAIDAMGRKLQSSLGRNQYSGRVFYFIWKSSTILLATGLIVFHNTFTELPTISTTGCLIISLAKEKNNNQQIQGNSVNLLGLFVPINNRWRHWISKDRL